MNVRSFARVAVGILAAASLYAAPSIAQQVQIPTLQVCNFTKIVANNALVHVDSRMPFGFLGNFTLSGRLMCDPAGPSPYPTGALSILGVNMNDSAILGNIMLTTFEQVASTGGLNPSTGVPVPGGATPTAWVNGRCRAGDAAGAPRIPCHYWLMVVDNKRDDPVAGQTSDIVSFLVLGADGKRLAYGTGPVVQGAVSVAPAK
jgi:hypothetical protein